MAVSSQLAGFAEETMPDFGNFDAGQRARNLNKTIDQMTGCRP